MASTTPPDLIAFKRIEFLVITKNEELLSVSKDLVEHYDFRSEFSDSVESIDADTRLGSSPLMILMSLEELPTLQEKIKSLQQLRDAFPRSQIVAVVAGNENPEDYDMLRGSGARYLMHLQEIKNSGKVYYLAALLVQGTYIPVPVSDLFPSTQVNFNAYHKLVLNQKFLPVIFSGFNFSDKKYRQLEEAQQVYIRRDELGEYRKYIETYHDQVGAALKKRCRVVMMNLMALYSEILLLLSLDCESVRKDLIQEKVAQFVQASTDLGGYLKGCPDVWNVIARALDFQFSRFERGPFILAYAVHISMKAEWGVFQDVIMTALLADLGILDLPSATFKTLQSKNEKQLKDQELELYQHHPMTSLNRVLQRELEVSNETKSNIVCTHERNDLKGFPNQTPAEMIPAEAQLIQFCELLDRRVRASLEDGTLTHDFIRKQVWEEEKDSLKRFNAAFLDKIEKVLIA